MEEPGRKERVKKEVKRIFEEWGVRGTQQPSNNPKTKKVKEP